MHFRLPKPLHGWREFAGEVGIIVLGVLIALGAEQVIQSIHQRQDVVQLRDALDAELADDRARWEDMRTQDRCSMLRLDAVERWLATAPPDARLPQAYRLFLWNMHSSAWDLAKTSPAAAHIPLKERLTYASLYGAIDNWRPSIAEEGANAMQLGALLATADQPENRRQIAEHIYTARALIRRRTSNYPYFFARFDELRIRPDGSQLTVAHDPLLLCKPLEG
jgi:hypothetical protein